MNVWLVLFVALLGLGIAAGIALWRGDAVPITPGMGARSIFRIVHREDRAAYVRMMRRTYAVAMRDAGRQALGAARQIGKELLPALRRFADAVAAIEKRFGG